MSGPGSQHQPRTGRGSTLSAAATLRLSSEPRTSASEWSPMRELYDASIIAVEVSCTYATTRTGMPATSCRVIELCRKAYNVTTSGSSFACLTILRKGSRGSDACQVVPSGLVSSGALGEVPAARRKVAAKPAGIGTGRRSICFPLPAF